LTSTRQITESSLPGLYQAADQASLDAQRGYFLGLLSYLSLLTIASAVSLYWAEEELGALLSAFLFLASLGILIFLRVKRPDDIWYNGRAVAESVKTRAWRWMMRADPYDKVDSETMAESFFIADLKAILIQNRSLAAALSTNAYVSEPISPTMRDIRRLSAADRLNVYLIDRVQDQANWYGSKYLFNRKRAQLWFWTSVLLHGMAICLLLLRVQDPHLKLPVEVIAVAASGVLTWLQAKKHNELASSYSLTAHEIVLIKGESSSIRDEGHLSEFVVSSEAAFSREHIQWAARKNE
jgi:hypothetical protein